MTAGRTLDRSRLERLMAAEMAAFEQANPRSRALFEQAKGSLLDGVPMNWMVKWAGAYPLFVDSGVAARTSPTSTATSTWTSASATRARWPATAPRRRSAPSSARLRRGITHMLPTEDAAAVGRRAPPPVRPPLLAVHAHRHRREPVRDPARPPHHGPPEDPRPQPLLPRLGGRDVRRHRGGRRRGRPAREHRQAGGAGRDDARRGDQRPRGPRARAGARRRRGRAHRAGADQRRHRPAGARLPRGRPGADAPVRDAADQRRDAHDLRRPRRLHGRPRPGAGHADDRQDDRRRDPGRRLRLHRGGRRPDPRGRSSGRTPTSAGSAGRSPATRCPWPRSGRRSPRS